MYKLILTTNDGNNESETVIVARKHYTKLQDLEYCGGFKRFDIELYDNTIPKQTSETKKVVEFLTKVFENKPLIQSYFN